MAINRRSQHPTIIIDHPEAYWNTQEKFKKIPQEAMARFVTLPMIPKIALGATLVLSLSFYGFIFQTLFTNHLRQETFLEISKCPACYGKSMCSELTSGNLTLEGLSSIRFLQFANVKNVYVSRRGSKKIILKKLGHSYELNALDKRICVDSGYDKNCDSTRAIYQTKYALEREMNPAVIKGLSPAMHCPSQRLVDRIVEYYKEKKNKVEFQNEDRLQIITTLMINAEPIIMQSFPPSEGYPFPKYIGACGRFVVMEYVGPTLEKYYDSLWIERIDFSYQLMLMAEQLTNHELGYSFYLTDVTYDNFAVNREGKVIVIDLEDILIVDRAKIRYTKPEGWDIPYYSEFTECSPGETDCTSYIPDDLCTHMTVDHNYYMICRNLLSEFGNDPNFPDGLLHDIPDDIERKWQLKMLVRECAKPYIPAGRLKSKDQLFTALEEIRKDYL